jgi:hypothetical protein
VKRKKMKKTKTIGLISVVAIAMALTIVFSGVALASHPVPPTDETETLDITTTITCTGDVVESQWLSLEIGSGNLLDNPPLANNEKYGKIGYKEKMIASSGTTEFDKCFVVDTGTTPNLDVHKQIGYTAKHVRVRLIIQSGNKNSAPSNTATQLLLNLVFLETARK